MIGPWHIHVDGNMIRRRSRLTVGAALLTAALCYPFIHDALAQASPTSAELTTPVGAQPEIVSIVVPDMGTFGGDVSMHTEVYKPAGAGPFPVLIFSHGRSAQRAERALLEHPVLNGHVKYWLGKGFAVVAPIRVGYGQTGGPDRENSGAHFTRTGLCDGVPDFRRVAKAASQDLLATIRWVREQPWADRERIVLEGRSAGGFATIATAATHPPGVIGYINFSGGTGGAPEIAPGHSCDPEQMKAVMAEFGKTTTIPGIWLYAQNDLYWGPEVPREWFDAFESSGAPAQFVDAGILPGHDGHMLLTYGHKMWSVPVDRFLKQFGY